MLVTERWRVSTLNQNSEQNMSWKSKAWAFAGTVAALEKMRTDKLCESNSSLESLHHHHQAIKNMRPAVSTQVESSSSSKTISKKRRIGKQDKIDQSEESLRKIMLLSCWGPYN